MIAIGCIQENPYLRPNIRMVVQMLEGVIQVHVPPCPTPFLKPIGVLLHGYGMSWTRIIILIYLLY